MFGLYDTDGILRFTGRDREACIAYAELFGLNATGAGGFSLIALPEKPTALRTKRRKKTRLVASSN